MPESCNRTTNRRMTCFEPFLFEESPLRRNHSDKGWYLSFLVTAMQASHSQSTASSFHSQGLASARVAIDIHPYCLGCCPFCSLLNREARHLSPYFPQAHDKKRSQPLFHPPALFSLHLTVFEKKFLLKKAPSQ
jgi:hypothetical protein